MVSVVFDNRERFEFNVGVEEGKFSKAVVDIEVGEFGLQRGEEHPVERVRAKAAANSEDHDLNIRNRTGKTHIELNMTMKWILGLAVLLTLCSCGGLGTPGTAFAVSPKTATTTPGGTVNLIAVVANADVASYTYSVVGGSANGTVVKNFNDPARAQYTAPATPGVYTVHVTITEFSGNVDEDDATITVN